MEAINMAHFAPANRIAQRFVAARLNAVATVDYPGSIPPDLASAYEVQEAAIALWPDEIAGWKIGRIPPAFEQKLGATRLAGPIFRKAVQHASGDMVVELGIIEGGFAAVEAEFVFEIGTDAPPNQLRWSLNDAAAIVGRMLVGVELAGSPLATINALGPTVVVSDFGNNAGAVIGPEVANWRDRTLTDLCAETFIDGKSVGTGTAASVYGGPLGALQFVAELCANRGRPLKAGMLISTGAATGIHDIVAGQKARIEFKGIGTIHCAAKTRVVQKS
jgi:2-keto-4-pentenoate hydratase